MADEAGMYESESTAQEEVLVTTDQGQVREWAKARALHPRIRDGELSLTDGQAITWEEWFARFEAEGLALAFEGTKEDGPRSVVYRLQPR